MNSLHFKIRNKYHYSQDDLILALKKVGLSKGDIVLTHSNIGFFGIHKDCKSTDEIVNAIFNAFFEIIGNEGTLIVPTFSYSYTKEEIYDPLNTPSAVGIFSEKIRKFDFAIRSHDPIFSVAAIGKNAEELTNNVSNECFGKNSFWDRFYKLNGKICNLNSFGCASTFLHYVEKSINVPYRYDKYFEGLKLINNRLIPSNAIYYVSDKSNSKTINDITFFNQFARESGYAKFCKVGKGYIASITAQETYELICDKSKNYPYFLTEYGLETKNIELIKTDKHKVINIQRVNSQEQIIQELNSIPRHYISNGINEILSVIQNLLPIKIHKLYSGTKINDYYIPEQWECDTVEIKDQNGDDILLNRDLPFHIIPYSRSYKGILSQTEVSKHLSVVNSIADIQICKDFINQTKWGFFCDTSTLGRFNSNQISVEIESILRYGSLMIGDYLIEGKREDTLVFISFIEPTITGQNGLTGLIIGINLMKHLSNLSDLKYSYRLIIAPQGFNLANYFIANSHNFRHNKLGILLQYLGLSDSLSINFPAEYKNLLKKFRKLAAKDVLISSDSQKEFSEIINTFAYPHNFSFPVISVSSNLSNPLPKNESIIDKFNKVNKKSLDDSFKKIIKIIEVIEGHDILKFNGFKNI